MKQLAPNTPVIVGVGFDQQKSDDPKQCSEAYELMVNAVRAAAADAGSERLLSQLESISVPQGLWQYRNPGKLIADALGCPAAKSIVSTLGVLQLTLLSDLCRAIAAGSQDLGVVVAGEAKFRTLRSTITQQPVSETRQDEDTPPPDLRMTSSDLFCSDLESQRGFTAAVEFFAVIESALRHRRGLGIEEHRDEIAVLYSELSRIASENPHAWRRDALSAETIRNASAKNAMQAFPYTKLHCSQWNVNQSVAILVCSVAKAETLGLDPSRWIHPLSTAESKHVVVLAQKRDLHTQPGAVVAGKRALELAGVSIEDVSAADLYSCFPAAIRTFASDLELGGRCPLSVTGAMAFAGGPFNHASLEGVARMVEVLRSGEANGGRARRVGLVSNLSGIFGKQACALFSNQPADGGYHYEDVTEAVAARDVPVPLDPDYVGPASIVGYTVVYDAAGVSRAVAICDTPVGERTVGFSRDTALLEVMTREEFCGRTVVVGADGTFRAA